MNAYWNHRERLDNFVLEGRSDAENCLKKEASTVLWSIATMLRERAQSLLSKSSLAKGELRKGFVLNLRNLYSLL